MSQFRYAALNRQGELLHGQIEAASAAEVISRLQEQGHIPLQAEIDTPAGGSGGWAGWRRGGISPLQQIEFTRQLGILLGAGQPLERALGVLVGTGPTPVLVAMVQRLRERIRGGAALSTAMEAEHGLFSRLYLSLVRAGEASGALDASLQQLTGYMERTQALRGHIVNAMIYPAFLLAGVLASLLLLLTYVVPQFVPIFADMQVSMPWITRAILALGQGLRQYGWLLLLLLTGLLVWGWRQWQQPAVRLRLDSRLLRLRGLGALLLKLETARLSRCLGTLLQHGVPLLTALQVAGQVGSHPVVAAGLQQAVAAVRDGAALSQALQQGQVLPEMAIQMIQVGEEAGQLDTLLLKVADTYEQETQRSIDRLLAALVPSLTLLMTAVVALIMAAILLPLLSLTSHIQ